jgi:hypothetical protein
MGEMRGNSYMKLKVLEHLTELIDKSGGRARMLLAISATFCPMRVHVVV